MQVHNIPVAGRLTSSCILISRQHWLGDAERQVVCESVFNLEVSSPT